jgi:hypothetical protein
MFSLSAFAIGPVISGTGTDVTPGPVPTPGHTSEHTPEVTEHQGAFGDPGIKASTGAKDGERLLRAG